MRVTLVDLLRKVPLHSKHVVAFSFCLHVCLYVHVSVPKVEMVNPMKNKKCNHLYDKEAIVNLIKAKLSQKKKCR